MSAKRSKKKPAATSAAPPREFKPGDRVKLHSGSPMMTVVEIGKHHGDVYCRWMSEDGLITEAAFRPAALTNFTP